MVSFAVVDVRRTVRLSIVKFPEDWPDYALPGQAEIICVKPDGCVLLNACPGCGQVSGMKIGFRTKPDAPGWLLTVGDPDDAMTWTVIPSINCVGCCGWHGYLRAGVFSV
jgi:hypothetical protein